MIIRVLRESSENADVEGAAYALGRDRYITSHYGKPRVSGDTITVERNARDFVHPNMEFTYDGVSWSLTMELDKYRCKIGGLKLKSPADFVKYWAMSYKDLLGDWKIDIMSSDFSSVPKLGREFKDDFKSLARAVAKNV